MTRSLRAQLSLLIVLVVIITVALISIPANILMNRQFDEYIKSQEEIRSENIVSDLGLQHNGLEKSWNMDYIHTIGMYSLYDGYILKIYDLGGNIIWDAENHDMSLCQQTMDGISARMDRFGNSGDFASHIYEIKNAEQVVGSVSIIYYGPFFYSESDVNFIGALNSILIIIGIFSFAFSIAVGWLFAKKISSPITKTADIAKQISQGNYNIRFESKTKTKELNYLISTVNRLACELDKQENLRKRLTTDVAHELRTPLTAVSSHLEAMIDGIWEVTPEKLKGCYQEIIRLSKLVADLGSLSKIECENLKLQKSYVDLLEIVKSVCSNMEINIKRKNLMLLIQGESSFANVDKDRINQVITNLLSNAVKYSYENKKIQIGVADLDKSSIITIEDEGIGIPEDEIPLIFERFYRTDKSRNRKTGGAGIGLTIVKSIVAAHGGIVSVDSQVNKGSKFTITLPKDVD